MAKELISSTPGYQDYVKHKKNDTTGTVIAVYEKRLPLYCEWRETGSRTFICFDVRTDDDKIYYGTPADNWEKVRKADE